MLELEICEDNANNALLWCFMMFLGAMLVLQSIILPFRGLLCLHYFGPVLASHPWATGGLVPTNMSQGVHPVTIQVALLRSLKQENGYTSTAHPCVPFPVLVVAKIQPKIGQQLTTPVLERHWRRTSSHQHEPGRGYILSPFRWLFLGP